MPTAAAYLESYGVTMEDARSFIWSNLSNPQLIFSTSKMFGITNEMLGQIVSVDESAVRSFWTNVGLNPDELNTQSDGPPVGYETLDSTYFQIVTGTSGDDTFTHTSGNKIYFGFGGNDHFENSIRSEGRAVFIGGRGDDSYEIFPAGETYLIDMGGGSDSVMNYAIGFSASTFSLEDRFFAVDIFNNYTNDLATIIYGDMSQNEDQIESMTDPYTGKEGETNVFISTLMAGSNYQGDIDFKDLGLSGLAIREGYVDLIGIYEEYLAAGY